MKKHWRIKILRKFSIGAAVLSITGCATGYHKLNYTGEGYSEISTNSDSFLVTFKGNACTSPEKVLQYALLRASELTIQNGYKYFLVTSTIDQTSSINYSSIYNSITVYNTLHKPGASIGIKCFKKKSNIDGIIDAEFYLKANRYIDG